MERISSSVAPYCLTIEVSVFLTESEFAVNFARSAPFKVVVYENLPIAAGADTFPSPTTVTVDEEKNNRQDTMVTAIAAIPIATFNSRFILLLLLTILFVLSSGMSIAIMKGK